jgi:hypothetical protein
VGTDKRPKTAVDGSGCWTLAVDRGRIARSADAEGCASSPISAAARLKLGLLLCAPTRREREGRACVCRSPGSGVAIDI